jgi:hypothetical protein
MDDEEYMASDEEYEYIYSDDDNDGDDILEEDNDVHNSDMMSLEMEGTDNGKDSNNNGDEFATKRHRPGSASVDRTKRSSTSSHTSGGGSGVASRSDDGFASAMVMHGE